MRLETISHSCSIGCGVSFAQQSVLHTKDFCYEPPLLYVPSHPSSVFLLLLSPFSLLPNIAPNACPSYKDFAVSTVFSKAKSEQWKSPNEWVSTALIPRPCLATLKVFLI